MATPASTPKQPKIVQRLLLRTATLLFSLAILFLAFRYLKDRNNDLDNGSSSTAEDIAALKRTDNGSEAVIIRPGGAISGTDSWKDSVNDQDLAWSPDGRFLFFVSDRDDKTFHVFRWNPDAGDASPRTTDKSARNSPTFPAGQSAEAKPLVIGGGMVQQLDPSKNLTPQLLPPQSSTITQTEGDEQGGSEALFEAAYGDLGTSFRYARYCKGEQFIAAIMERDGGETLVIQDMTPLPTGGLAKIIPVAAARHIDFDVNPATGDVVFSATVMMIPPTAKKKPKQVPLRSILATFDPVRKQETLIGASQDDKLAFGAPAVSPDGNALVISEGPYDAGTESLQPKALLSMPVQEAGMRGGSILVQGDVYEPSWSPAGDLITFAMNKDGHRDIYTIHKDGSSQYNVTGGKGDFQDPVFSPQLKG